MQEYFQQLNEYYDKIFVLSLPRLTERVAHINKTLAGLNFEIFYGVDKQAVLMDELKQQGLYSTQLYQRFYKKPKEIPLGMLCCSLGHVKIYEHIVKNKYQKTLILEDDAVPVAEGLIHLTRIVEELPADWELLYLGYEKNENYGLMQKLNRFISKTLPRHSQLKLTRQIYSRYYPVSLSPHIARAGFHDCTHAYSITQQAAGKLIQQQHPVRFHPDNLLSYMIATGQLRGYIARPKLFNQLSAWGNSLESLTAD